MNSAAVAHFICYFKVLIHDQFHCLAVWRHYYHYQISIKENCLPARGELISLRLQAQVEINVWPNTDLTVFPGLLTLEPDQESPTDGRADSGSVGKPGNRYVTRLPWWMSWQWSRICSVEVQGWMLIRWRERWKNSPRSISAVQHFCRQLESCSCYYCVISSANMEFHKAPLLA